MVLRRTNERGRSRIQKGPETSDLPILLAIARMPPRAEGFPRRFGKDALCSGE